jgi:hypothetical protein
MVGEGIIRFDPLAPKDPRSHDPKDPRSEIDIMQAMPSLINDIMC